MADNKNVLVTYMYMLTWIVLSAGVILLNKFILSYSHFPFPVALTAIHMAFCSILAFVLVKMGFAEVAPIPLDTYLSCVMPIGALFAGTLWLGNAAYLYLEVSFIQMLKASMPMVVYVVGVGFKTETFSMRQIVNMVVVVTGILIASYGEINFVVIGVVYQVTSLLTESVRLTLIQILLQSKGIKLNPIATLYHIAPCCFVFLCLPLLYLELPLLTNDPQTNFNWPLLLGSAASAFALNVAVFMLIGRSSALTMNVAGVVKDWLLILLSVVLYGSTVTLTQLGGYGLAFCGVAYYNYRKFHTRHMAPAAVKDSESQPLLEKSHSNQKQLGGVGQGVEWQVAPGGRKEGRKGFTFESRSSP